MALDTNWRNTGTYYVDPVFGDDSNPGTKALPFKTVKNILSGQTIIVRAVSIFQSISSSASAVANIISENGTVWRSESGLLMINNTFQYLYCKRIEFGNMTATLIFAGIALEDCILKNCDFSIGRSTSTSLSCFKTVFFQSILNWRPINSQSVYDEKIVLCTFVSSTLRALILTQPSHSIIKCCFDRNSEIDIVANRSISISNCAFEQDGATGFQFTGSISNTIKNLTLNGDADTIGNTYADGEKFSGTITNGTGTITFNDCFWTADFGFIDPANGNFYLKSNFQFPGQQSKLYNRGDIIGRFGLGIAIDASHPAFNPANSGVSIPANVSIVGGNTFQLDSGTEATIVSTDDPANAIALPFAATLNEFILFFGTTFSLNQPQGNKELIDKANYDPVTNEEVRPTYEVAVYNENTLTWSAWYEMEVNGKWELDNTGKGNGDVDVDFASIGAITGRVFRVRFTLRNNGY